MKIIIYEKFKKFQISKKKNIKLKSANFNHEGKSWKQKKKQWKR